MVFPEHYTREDKIGSIVILSMFVGSGLFLLGVNTWVNGVASSMEAISTFGLIAVLAIGCFAFVFGVGSIMSEW